MNPLKIDEIFGGLTWEAQIPIEYQRNEPTIGDKTTEEWKKMGNDHYAAKRFKESVTAYTNGIDSETIKSKLGLDLLSNRSAAYLKLCNYNLALVDAQSVLDVDKGHIKCIFRKANALFGMARYKDAVSFLSNASVEQSSENKKVIDDLISKGETFIAQSDTGYYPWDNIAKMEFQNHCHDLAEYEGSVVVKDSPNKGRGLFATETIRAGQLILASKAFAYVVASNEAGIFLNSKDTKCIKTRSQTQLVTSIAQILNNCPEKCTEFYSLYGGANYSNKLSSEDFQVDVKRIEEICRYNSFGTGGFGNAAKDDVSGIWISPAFINHSCVDANSLWTLNGNFLFVRAFNDIAKGDEISISYLSPFHSVLQKNLDKYGFICDCRLCKRDRLDSPKIQSYRSDLQSKLAKGLEQKVKDQAYFNFIEEQEVSKLLRLLDKSREDAPELNIFFLSDIKTLALIYFENELYSSSASTLANVYNVSKSVASLWDFTLTIVINIIASYLMSGGDKHQALPWFEILKRYAILYCGSLNCIEVRAPNSVVMFEDYGLYLHG